MSPSVDATYLQILIVRKSQISGIYLGSVPFLSIALMMSPEQIPIDPSDQSSAQGSKFCVFWYEFFAQKGALLSAYAFRFWTLPRPSCTRRRIGRSEFFLPGLRPLQTFLSIFAEKLIKNIYCEGPVMCRLVMCQLFELLDDSLCDYAPLIDWHFPSFFTSGLWLDNGSDTQSGT